MISEGSCDTEDCVHTLKSYDAKISSLLSQEYISLKSIKIEKSYFKYQ